MSEVYSLDSSEFISIEKRLNKFFVDFYSSKRKIPQVNSKKLFLKEFERDLDLNMRRFLHEYDMGLVKRGGKTIITAELTSEIQEYIVYISKFQCSKSNGLKPAYTIQGKNAEAIVMCAINSFLDYFRISNKIKLNTKSFRYGGDGGYDFALGKYRFDVKHRDDGPNHGLILRDNFLDRAEDDIILIFVTNAANIKLGTKFNKDAFEKPFKDVSSLLREQVLPMALSGWITIGDFKKKRQARGGDGSAWVVDNLNPILDLFIMIMSDQIDSEKWFV